MEGKIEVYKSNEILLVFGQNIKVFRERKNMGIRQLAEKCAYDRECISKMERGEQNIKFMTAVKLARALDVSFAALFARNCVCELEESRFSTFQEDDYLRVFIENFERRLKAKGYLQLRTYALTGVSETVVSRIVRRKNINPTIKTLAAMAYAVQADMSDLLKRNEF